MIKPYRDRTEAGRLLAERLGAYAHRPDVMVLALPRGGVPVAYEVAQVLEAPIAAPSMCALFQSEVDEISCGRTPEPFTSVGHWYEDFSQTTDREVRDLLDQSRHDRAA